MSEPQETGFVALNSDMYFTCSSGLTPAKINPTQVAHKTKEGYSYLVKDDTGCPAIGDFMCRWTVVLAAAIAAAGVVTGGAALAVLAVVAVAASAALCGGLMASMRKWVGYSTFNAYGRKDAYSLTSKCQMVCPIGGVITYAPGITGEWQALLYTARNTTWAVAEGFLLGKLGSCGFSAFAGTATPAMSTALLNFAALNVGARAMGTADQVLFEGMLRNGKKMSETGEEAKAGATMFEQPFINIYNRAKSGYYTGGYTEGPEIDEQGNEKIVRRPEDIARFDWGPIHMKHGSSALATDVYYAGLSAVSMGMMAKGAATHENIAKEAFLAAKETIAKAMKGGKKFLFERGKISPTLSSDAIKHSNEGEFANPVNPKKSMEPGKMKSGGHGEDNIRLLDRLGRKYTVVRKFKNGVRLGNIDMHGNKMKRTGTGQSWFPSEWTAGDIEAAGNKVIHDTPNFDKIPDGLPVYGDYNGVRVGVIKTDGVSATVFPDGTWQPGEIPSPLPIKNNNYDDK